MQYFANLLMGLKAVQKLRIEVDCLVAFLGCTVVVHYSNYFLETDWDCNLESMEVDLWDTLEAVHKRADYG